MHAVSEMVSVLKIRGQWGSLVRARAMPGISVLTTLPQDVWYTIW